MTPGQRRPRLRHHSLQAQRLQHLVSGTHHRGQHRQPVAALHRLPFATILMHMRDNAEGVLAIK